jgi:predicted HAD superfamily Cof-like phosphohydrolase
MSKNHYRDILDFHEKFRVPLAPKHTLLEGEALKFRLDFLQEELDELRKAHEEGNLEDAVDALIDLEVVLLGTGQFMGISEEAYENHWEEVHRANMTKERCTDASQSKRGTALDIRKPAGWVGPNHTPIIEKYRG